MDTLIVIGLVTASIGVYAYRNGKRTGSRKGYNVGRRQGTRRGTRRRG